jgi:hypothetical protein
MAAFCELGTWLSSNEALRMMWMKGSKMPTVSRRTDVGSFRWGMQKNYSFNLYGKPVNFCQAWGVNVGDAAFSVAVWTPFTLSVKN